MVRVSFEIIGLELGLGLGQGRAAPRIKVGVQKQDLRMERAEKNCTRHFSKSGGTSKQISVGAY